MIRIRDRDQTQNLHLDYDWGQDHAQDHDNDRDASSSPKPALSLAWQPVRSCKAGSVAVCQELHAVVVGASPCSGVPPCSSGPHPLPGMYQPSPPAGLGSGWGCTVREEPWGAVRGLGELGSAPH